MTKNLAIWEQLERTDPEHVKPFTRPGGFKGHAVKPIYVIKKLTEVFGTCGGGWGTDAPTFEIVGDAVFCTLALWYVWSDKQTTPQRVYGVGGDTIVKDNRGERRPDDEAFKKAFTDALTNAAKHLGMSADVHMGRFDDSKYVASAPGKPASARGGNGAGDTPASAPPSPTGLQEPARGKGLKERCIEIAAAYDGAPDIAELNKLEARLRDEIAAMPDKAKSMLAAAFHRNREALAPLDDTQDAIADLHAMASTEGPTT